MTEIEPKQYFLQAPHKGNSSTEAWVFLNAICGDKGGKISFELKMILTRPFTPNNHWKLKLRTFYLFIYLYTHIYIYTKSNLIGNSGSSLANANFNTLIELFWLHEFTTKILRIIDFIHLVYTFRSSLNRKKASPKIYFMI